MIPIVACLGVISRYKGASINGLHSGRTENSKLRRFRIVGEIMAQSVPRVGWTMEMCIDSWGNPDDRQTVEKPMGSEDTWIYYEPPGGINRTVIKFDHRRAVIHVATDR